MSYTVVFLWIYPFYIISFKNKCPDWIYREVRPVKIFKKHQKEKQDLNVFVETYSFVETFYNSVRGRFGGNSSSKIVFSVYSLYIIRFEK